MGRPSRQMAIEAEFGEPFWDVVKGFADAGHSRTDTAGILDYSQGAFFRLIDHHGRADWFVYGQDSIGAVESRNARKGRASQALLDAAKKASEANPTYRWYEVDGIRDTICGHARRHGISHKTVRSRLARGMSIKQALAKTSYWKSPDNSAHPWRHERARFDRVNG